MTHSQTPEGATALITGAARRVGAAIASHLHAAGLNVVIHYRRSHDAAETLAAELNGQRQASAFTLATDLTDSNALPLLIRDAIACTGRLDVLVNNASAFFPTPLEKLTESDWSTLMDVNLKAPLFLARHAAAELRQRNGCIINITDIHAVRPLKNHSLYSTSKAGLVMLTQALARELAPEIRVNAISPGAILWPEDMDESTKNEILSRIALGRRGSPEDVARGVLYLVRDAGYVTGQVLTIDGGRTLYS